MLLGACLRPRQTSGNGVSWMLPSSNHRAKTCRYGLNLRTATMRLGIISETLSSPGNYRCTSATHPFTQCTPLYAPCCAIIFLRIYPAVPLSRFSLPTYPAVPLSRFSITAYPAALTVLCYYFSSHSCRLIMPLFDYHLPCRAHIFLRSYPAVPLFLFALTLLFPYFSSHLPCCALIFLRTYPAVPLSAF